MKKKSSIVFVFIALLVACSGNKAKEGFSDNAEIKNYDFRIELGKVSPRSVFADDTKHIWGASVVKGDDGLFHMFYSRWEKELGWAWVTHSEIAHAVSESPFGPFKHRDVALPLRGAEFWDGLCTHNPTIHKFDGKYYLYYMGNTGDGVNPCVPGEIKYNWIHRNNQRIGVAVANDPNGPWKRFDAPLIDASADSTALDALLANNPSITRRPDGGYLMVYKAVGKKIKRVSGGPVVHCVATSESPTGPFTKYDKPVFTAKGTDFPAEDPFIWYQDGKYRAIVKDMHGAFTDAGQALVLFESADGFDWNLAKNPLVSKLEIEWKDGGIQKLKHLERPQIYMENGKPIALLCAADTMDSEGVLHSWNVQIPIKHSFSQAVLDFASRLPEKFDKANIIEEEDYNVWGTNILKGKDGKYHAIYSRWLKSRGHHGWATHSEIAHAVSDKLSGPYKFKNIVLPARGYEYWDGDCTHNPHVVKYKGKYYLYHMGNHGSGYWDTTPDDRMPVMKDEEWWVNRNNQRIGVAVADDLNGEWKRFEKPLVDIDATRRLTSTPVVSKRPDGKFLMVYKYVKEEEGMYGGKVVHVTALSDSPLGPFNDTGIPFIETEASKFALDDHIEWFQDGTYFCIGKDHDGSLTPYDRGSMVLYTSDDEGLHWNLAEQPLVLKAGKIEWSDGTETLCTRTADMPKLYVENDVPKALIIAVLPKNSEISFSMVIPLND